MNKDLVMECADRFDRHVATFLVSFSKNPKNYPDAYPSPLVSWIARHPRFKSMSQSELEAVGRRVDYSVTQELSWDNNHCWCVTQVRSIRANGENYPAGTLFAQRSGLSPMGVRTIPYLVDRLAEPSRWDGPDVSTVENELESNIVLRVSRYAKARYVKAAAKQGITLAEFMLQAADKHALDCVAFPRRETV